ncbi:MAG: hypothetical protein JWL97_4456 [Gemmatimonadales bacterium]|jgi:hypothetical protein|nr:hypothetical protein [Gemmatimonadales bacterium]
MTGTYAVIGNDGLVRIETGNWRSPFGSDGPARVTIHPDSAAVAWVNDNGYAQPETCPRNLVGSVLLWLLGAASRPYAGPVVITRWEEPPGREVLPLETRDVKYEGITAPFLERTVTDIRRVLDLEPGAVDMHPSLADDVREFVELVRTAELPKLTVVPLAQPAT